jgi:hypothetical protein
MSLYLVAGQNAATDPADSLTHLPTRRPRRYPSDTSDAEWEILAPYVPAGGPAPGRGGRPVTLHLPKSRPGRSGGVLVFVETSHELLLSSSGL